MKKILIAVVVVFLLCSAKFSYADDAAKRQLAEKLLKTMKSEEQYKKTMEQAKKSQDEMMASIPGYKKDPALEKTTADLMKDDLSYEKMHEDMVTAYAEVFTEEELQGLVNFYESPLGQAYVDKVPELTKRMMESNQKRIMGPQSKMGQMMKADMKNIEDIQKKMQGMQGTQDMPGMPQDGGVSNP